MYSSRWVGALIACLLSQAAHAESKKVNNGGILLDQTKNVFFEQYSANTFSLQVLQDKNKFDPHSLILGGLFETDLQHWQGEKIDLFPSGKYQQGTGVYFTQATIDFMPYFNHWAIPFLSIADSHIGRAGPDTNYVFLQRAFIVFGNLDSFPVYVTTGINTIPFGTFVGSGPWDTPLTADYFNLSQAPQVTIGFYKNGLNASATEFSDAANHNNNFVYSFYYNKIRDNWGFNFGAGYLTDLKTNNSANTNLLRNSRKQVPILDMHAVLDLNGGIQYRQAIMSAEYLRASSKVGNNRDVPEAYSLVMTYTPKIAGKDTTFGISHSESFNLKDIPTSLSGFNELQLASSGLKNAWSVNVSRSVFTKFVSLALNIAREQTYSNKINYASTIDIVVYF